jgi:rubrerythrin
MTSVNENLQTAFAGESQARNKYTAFALKADEEGLPQVARLFRAAAAAEQVHALNHLRAMSGVHGTAENLKAAIDGESYEVTTMYPPFISDAEKAGDKKATTSFRWAWEVEKTHEALYRQMLDSLGKTEESYDYYICPVCGHTHARNAPDKCPVCGTPGSRFMKVS